MTVSIISGIPIFAGPLDIVTSIQAPNIPGGGAIGIGDVFGLQAALDTKLQDVIGTIAPLTVDVTVTGAELNFLAGVTSDIQPQLDGKVDLAGDTMTGDLVMAASVQLLIDPATAALPGLAIVGDLDTGIWWPAADTLGFAVGSLDAFQILPSGLLQSQNATYETLVVLDDDMPNKKYVDDAIVAVTGGPFLELAGGVMTGDIDLDTNNITFDADLDTYFTSSVDDILNLYIGGILGFVFDASCLDVQTKTVKNVVNPVNPQDAATMDYVDTEISDLNLGGTVGPYLPLSGVDAMTGPLDMGTQLINNVVNPVGAQDAATMDYVDTEIADLMLGGTVGPYLPLSGADAMTGLLDMGAFRATNLADPTAPQDAVTQAFADTTYMPVDGSIPATGNLDAGGNNIINVADPVDPQDAATKQWTEDNFLDLLGTSAMLGALDMGGFGIGNLLAATANDEAVNLGQTNLLYLRLDGTSTMAGALAMGGNTIGGVTNPSLAQDAATKDYVDSNFLDLAGTSAMSGAIDMAGAGQINNLLGPTVAADAATKGYVDTEISGLASGGTFVTVSGDTMTGDLIMDTGVQHSADDGTLGAPAYAFTNALDTGMWYDGTNLRLALSAGSALTISPAGGANEVDVHGRQVVGVADPTADDHAVTRGFLNSFSAVKLLGSVTGVSLLATGTTTIYTVPSGKMHIITQVLVRPTAYTPGGAPTNPTASVGLTGTFNQIIPDGTVLDWGGTAGAADQVVYLQPKDGADTPNAGDLVRFQVDTAGAGTFSALTATVYVLGIEL